MSGEQFHRIDEIFKRAVLLTPPEREAYLDEACGDDTTLRDEVLSLLSVDDDLPAATEKMAADVIEGVTEPGSPGGSAPHRIGRFTTRREIARGGMGAVYEAMQEQPHRRVAIKLIRPTLVTPATLRRFEFEAQVLGRLRHPNIAQVYEAGTHQEGGESVPYFAMEYVPGALPITDYARRKKLSIRERLELYTKVCDAIHHGHQKGIVHRDLKPGNILVDSHGEPKVIDFGVAHATDSDLARTTLQTEIGQLIGTLSYMSPEQVDGDPEDLDTRSDVYALGVVLYELLCERHPYELDAAKMAEAFQIIQELQPQRPSQISKVLRGDVETITLKALEKERERRYQSADEFGRDIRHYLDGEPITAHPPSAIYHLQVFTRRHRVAVVAGLIVTVVVTAAAVIGVRSSIMQARAEAAEARAEQRAALIATNILDDFLTEVLRPRALPVHVRNELSRQAKISLDSIRDEVGNDPAIRQPLASAFESIGNVLYSTSGGHDGQAGAALAMHEEALRLRTELVDEGAASELVLLPLADSLTAIGDCLKAIESDPTRALSHYSNARTICEEVAAADPDLRLAQRRLARALSKIARIYAPDPDRIGEGATLMERSLEIRRANVKRWPDKETTRDLAVGCNRLASIRARQGRHDEADRLREESLAIRRDRARRYPDWSSRRDVAVALNASARRALQETDSDSAIALLGESRGILDQLALEDPENMRLRYDLGNTCVYLGRSYAMAGDEDEAGHWHVKAIEIARELYDAAPDNVLFQRQLAVAHSDLGDLLIATGSTDVAIEHLERAQTLYTPLAAGNDELATALTELRAELVRLRGMRD